MTPSSTSTPAQWQDAMLQAARDPDSTPFDYIVIGSGAGGGPLAARLAEGGKRVLLLEAGFDPATPDSQALQPGVIPAASASPQHEDRTVYRVPVLHGAATEDARMSWAFSVRHFQSDAAQRADSKYVSAQDPAALGQSGKGGILYPRSSALGGCTAHHAMIIVKPNDSDWNRIAALTGDPGWRAESMQGYFTRIEKCLYYEDYRGFLKKVVLLYRQAAKVVEWINPRWQLDRGGHGRNGWQKTSFISPLLVSKIARGDGTFLRLLLGVIVFLVRQPGRLRAACRSLLRFQFVRLLDPNFANARCGASGQVSFIPVGTDGAHRVGLRERLMSVAGQWPERLVMTGGVLATRILFKPDSQAPRACGVAVVPGARLYQVGAASAAVPAHGEQTHFFAREEVIVSGGTFNTPQLLMLSGIGDAQHLRDMGIEGPRDAQGRAIGPIIDLPGVGANLQDRYEVGVISHTRAPFRTLDGVTFDPDSRDDPALRQWLDTRSGLYTTNGGAVAFFLDTGKTPVTRQRDDGLPPDPDLFVFGVPAAFRGYYWGWSKQLLRESMTALEDRRDLWSWVLLKAYTSNNAGSVRLRSNSPFHQPEIVFRSFDEGPPTYVQDLDALCSGVEFVRRVNHATAMIGEEIQPGAARIDGSQELKDWIHAEAWGHHACGTCRMGSDPWKADTTQLVDRKAVLDNRLRVHGVRALRVVDASVFHRIPGYFIVTPVFMVSEKAADMLLADSAAYPEQLKAAEAAAIRTRRQIADSGRVPDEIAAEPLRPELPGQTVGLALSGGGIRSATFALGIMQALARRNRLRNVDYLSTVSGGGYIGAFLGQLFMRIARSVANPVERVQQTLANTGSNEIWWLRRHASYLLSAGRSDFQTHLGVIWRNLVTVHVVIGALLVALLAALRLIAGPTSAQACSHNWLSMLGCSPWWWAPGVLMLAVVLPMALGYWLAPKPGSAAVTPWFALIAWLVMIAGAIGMLSWPAAQVPALVVLGSLLLAWAWQELVRHPHPPQTSAAQMGSIVRNRLSRALGVALMLLAASMAWAVLDSIARTASAALEIPVVGGMVLLNLMLPAARALWERARALQARVVSRAAVSTQRKLGLGVIAFALATFLLLALDVLTHAAFDVSERVGLYLCGFALLLSLALGRATRFANLSSLQASYASKLARTFLGASNPARVNASVADVPPDVSQSHPQDDLPFAKYHPERNGGPLHLMNVCVNESADAITGRHLPEDKGLPMCVGPAGISVGVRYHALWTGDAIPVAKALPIGANPEAFHVLGRDDQQPARVENLKLSDWMAISGAAFTTGSGRDTSVAMSLLYGLLNVRIGYWWNSGIAAADRPGRFAPTFFHRLVSAPGALFRTQQMLLDEWGAYYRGPSARHWYLSDGAHFENSGLYELLRRRVSLMIALDGAEDGGYRFDDMAEISRKARLDFGARIEWIDPQRAGVTGWAAFDGGAVPAWVRDWFDPEAIGSLAQIRREGTACAALARVHYPGTTEVSWLLLIKPCLGPAGSSLDLRCYAQNHPQFPNQPTVDQFFDDEQWESYRLLGELCGDAVFRRP
jgi:choline dehydrogenase-like flavoprotein